MRKLVLLILILAKSLFPVFVQAQVIQELKVEGSTVFSAEEIDELIASYRHQNLEWQKLEEIATKLTNLYVDRGYITSGAFIPEQAIKEGVVAIEVNEGRLESVDIEGLKRLKRSYINSKLKEVHQGIFNLTELTKALESLQAEPLIEEVKAELVSGTSRSSSVLLLKIEEARVIQSVVTVNNRASPTIGEVRGIARLTHQNLLGLRDRAFVQYDVTEGFSTYELDYAVPLNYRGTALGLGYREGESRIIEDPFDDVNIRSEADTFSVKLTQELARSITTESSLSLIFDRSESKTFILDDQPFAFPGIPKDGLSKLSVLRLEGDWLKRSDVDILSIRSRLSFGVDLFEATVGNEPDALFFSWLGQIQYARALDRDQNIVLMKRLATQLSPDSLLPFERFSLGGRTTVRGYRQNRSIGDNAVVGTVAVALTMFDDEGWGQLKLIPFVDWGRVWNTDGDFAQSLASIGLRIDWQLRDSLFIGFDWGIPLTEVQKRGESLGDSGIHFSLKWKPSF